MVSAGAAFALVIGSGLLGAAGVADTASPVAMPRRTVYAWFPRDFNNRDTSAIDWAAITHLCFRSVVMQPDGTLKTPVPADAVRKLVGEAHSHGVKVTVLVWGTTPEGSSEYLANSAERAVQSLVAYVREHNLDGVNMDDETWREMNSVTGGPNRDLITAFFRRLREACDAERPGLHISWASPPVISAVETRYTDPWPDYAAIADTIDAFAIMAYCMNPPRIGWTTAAQPVEGGPIVQGHRRDYATCIRDYLEATGGRADKLLLGIANDRGGVEWDCRGPEPLSPIIGDPRKLSPAEARARAEEHGRLFHAEQKAPWYRYQRDDAWVQGWYEDAESLAAKLELANSFGLQGICIWVLDGASEPAETFELIREHLGSRS